MAFIYYVTQIQFEFGAVRLLAAECERIGITRPLVVTDPGVKAAGVLQQALDALPGLNVAVFDQKLGALASLGIIEDTIGVNAIISVLQTGMTENVERVIVLMVPNHRNGLAVILFECMF